MAAAEEFNCSVCLYAMPLEDESKHKCIIEFTNDRQGRFMIIDRLKEFYPITEGEYLTKVVSILIVNIINYNLKC